MGRRIASVGTPHADPDALRALCSAEVIAEEDVMAGVSDGDTH